MIKLAKPPRPMNTFIAAAVLLAATFTSAAASSDFRWDCRGGIGVGAETVNIGLTFPYAAGKGSRNLKLTWDLYNPDKPKMRLNGKACTRTN
jgi:hypothetical protein